jgi:hypothetical protein
MTTAESFAYQNPATDELGEESTQIDYVNEIETVIGSVAAEQKVMVGHDESGYAWKFRYGSVEVFVRLTGTTEEDTLTVWSPVLPLPANNEEQLMRRLLQMNWASTFESCFGIVDNKVVVLSSRVVEDLNPSEISRSITVVATIADDNDEALQEEFGTA